MAGWKKIIGSIVPTLGRVLGGPLGGMASGLVMKALKIDPKAPDAQKQLATQVQQASPETVAALRQAEMELETRLRELDIDLEQIHAADRDSARAREDRVGGWSNPILALIVMVGFFAITGAILGIDLDDTDATKVALIGALVGYVSAKADQVVSYYFGSSSDATRMTNNITGTK